MTSEKKFRERFWGMVEEADKIFITGHIGPDDDSIASMLAVYWLVKERLPKKRVRMICPGESTDEWGYFEGFEKIDFMDSLSLPFADEEPLVIMLDGSNFDRFSVKAGKTICIDHHKNEPDDFDLIYLSADFSSTVEGVYRLLVDGNKKIPKRLAEIFLLGILGDTGNFAYLNKETAGVLEIVQKLICDSGVSIQELQSKYLRYPKGILKLVGEMISNTKYFEKVGKWPAFQVGLVSKEFVDEHGFGDGDISTASHLYMSGYLRLVKGHGWGFVITPREDGTCSLSFRSLPDVVNVRKLAEKFNGGGHDLASGGEIKVKESEKALEMVLKVLQV